MVSRACPRLVIAGTASGVGKTSLTLALTRALTRRGRRVQTFKVGPDFLDPTYLALASGRPSYNLDGWMCGHDYVLRLVAQQTPSCDLIVIEGVMGLFDGATPDTLEGSTAEIAAWLQAPVVLVADSHGQARSFAAMVKGFASFAPDLALAGVIANRCGSARHTDWLKTALRGAGLPPLVGAVPRGALPELKSRHLGLITAEAGSFTSALLEALADGAERHLDLDALTALADGAPPLADAPAAPAPAPPAAPRVRIGVARDAAFHFYYPDTLDALRLAGAELVFFSPLADAALPERLHALYLGGGYPEAHAETLAANAAMCEAVRAFAASQRPVYAECGGLMYLARSVKTERGHFPMAGVLPFHTRMGARSRALAYREVQLIADSLWGPRGARLRGHEFHYSEIVPAETPDDGWQPAYQSVARNGATTPVESFQKGNLLASYVHLHLAAQPEAIRWFIRRCEACGQNSPVPTGGAGR